MTDIAKLSKGQPTVKCGECGARMILRDSKFGPFWGCGTWPRCDGKHGAHPNGRPLGVPASKATRRARIAAHAAFDALWKTGEMTRPEAYSWLAAHLGMSKRECHIGRFSVEQCAAVVVVIGEKFIGTAHAEDESR